MRRVKNDDGTITAHMSRADAFDIIDALLAQIKTNRTDITLTILDDQMSAGFLEALDQSNQ